MAPLGMNRVHSPDFASFVIFVQPSSQVSLQPHGLQHARIPSSSLLPGVLSQ